MKGKKLSAGEIRFRIGRLDLKRLDWLLANHPGEYRSVSALMRALIYHEYDSLTEDLTKEK